MMTEVFKLTLKHVTVHVHTAADVAIESLFVFLIKPRPMLQKLLDEV